MFVAAQAAGEIAGDIDLFVAQMLAFGAMNWTSEWFRQDLGTSPEQLADQAVRMLFHGVATPGS